MIAIWLVYILALMKIIYDACVLNTHLLLSWRWSFRQVLIEQSPRNGEPELIILLPVLREQAIIEATLAHLGKLPYPGRKQIVVITAEREIAENGGRCSGTTLELARHAIAKFDSDQSSSYKIIHYPYIHGNKSSQLNYALQQLIFHKEERDLTRTYIGVYDADSRPSTDTFIRLRSLIAVLEESHDWPIAVQQPSIFLRNFCDVSSWYLQLEALFETRWVLGQELRTLRASIKPHANWQAPYAYCVGHGIFIRADFLHNIKGFPEPIEDIPMGFRLDFANIPIYPLASYDICDVAPSIKTLIQQSGMWFRNAPSIWHEYHWTKSTPMVISPVRACTLLVKGIIDIFSWLHYFFYISTFLCILLVNPSIQLVISSLIALYLDAGVGIALMLYLLPHFSKKIDWNYPQLSFKKKIWFIVISPLRGLVRSIGPLMALIYWMKFLRKGEVSMLPKTERML